VNDEPLIGRLTDLAESFGYEVRVETLNFPGGACVLGGRKVLFLDARGNAEEKIATLSRALAGEDIDSIYLLPEVRDAIEHFSRPLG